MTHPSDYNIPHDSWRPGQEEAIDKLRAKPDGNVTFLQAAVGSGKTALAKAMAKDASVTSLVRTKNLQVENYMKTYSFDVLFGRGNYECVHPDKLYPDAMADQCLYENRMDECEHGGICPYLMQKRIVQGSDIRSLNYSYYLSSSWPRRPDMATEYGVFDECHILPDETLEFVGCTIKDADRLRWKLPEFPSCYDSSRDSVNTVLDWMEKSIGVLKVQQSSIKKDDADAKSKKSKIERLTAKLAQTCAGIHRSSDDWYVRSGMRALTFMSETRPGLVIKPLTARFHFPKLFLGVFSKTIMMSATIGNVEDLAGELGVDKYDFERVPNQWPASSRPVHVVDVPPMGFNASDDAKKLQASKIAGVLKELPGDWSGVLHVTSWKQAYDLKNRMIACGVPDRRLFIPTRGKGTNYQMTEWNSIKKPGMLVLTPSMNAGVDLLEERIVIVAKVPWGFAAPGSYENERRLYSERFYRWSTASDLEQRCGRTRRGRPEDYDTQWEKRGFVCIADGSFKKMGLHKSCSSDFVESLKYE